jgi:hypothetical protein
MMISDGVDSLISISTIWKEKNKRDNGFNKWRMIISFQFLRLGIFHKGWWLGRWHCLQRQERQTQHQELGQLSKY